MIADAGAYVFLSPYVVLYALVAAPGPYRVDNLNVFAQAVATNNMVHQRVPRLWRAAGLRRLRAADGRDRQRARHRPPGGAQTELPEDRPSPCPRASSRRARSGPSSAPSRPGRRWASSHRRKGRSGPGAASPATSRATAASPSCTTPRRPGWASRWTAPWWCAPASPTSGRARSRRSARSRWKCWASPSITSSSTHSDSAVTTLAGTTTATRALYMTGNAAKQAAEGLARPTGRTCGPGVRRRAG